MEPTRTTIVAVREVGPDTVAVDLESPAAFEARPGQFLKLSADVDGERVTRFYTLSSPDAEGVVEITIGIDPEGSLGPWIADPDREGDTVTVEGPYGGAHYEGEPASLVIAGGPGVGAAVGIGERAVAEGNEVTIVYRDDSPVHRDRLASLERAGATVVITGADIDEHVEKYLADQQVFVYGFQGFVTGALDVIEAGGGDPDAAKVESYG